MGGQKADYSEDNLRRVVSENRCYSDVLRELGVSASGGSSRKVLKKYIDEYGIDTSHFDPYYKNRGRLRKQQERDLDAILVKDSDYLNTTKLKKKLYREGLKEPKCEMCGQGRSWKGRRMSLIIDHINGVNNDHRLENLRIVCPNCNATLDTHAGRNARKSLNKCSYCGDKTRNEKYCSRQCSGKDKRGSQRKDQRKVERPGFEQLKKDINALGYLATGRKYGVSDNAIRKWEKNYKGQSTKTV
jgi:hypothetical protein